MIQSHDSIEDSPEEDVQIFERILGEPTDADSILAPDSSDESMREGHLRSMKKNVAESRLRRTTLLSSKLQK